MDPTPSFEDSITAGMTAVADGISRSFDIFLLDDVRAALRRVAAVFRRRPAPEPSDGQRIV